MGSGHKADNRMTDQPLRKRIKARLDALQDWMESNYHLKNPDEVRDLTHQISKFWTILSEEDREYVQYAQHAIDEGREWNVNLEHEDSE